MIIFYNAQLIKFYDIFSIILVASPPTAPI